MFDPSETIEHEMDPSAVVCLRATRSAVLNVLVVIGMTVALSGVMLRGRGREVQAVGPSRLATTLLAVLLLIFAASTILRRWLGRRSWLREPFSRGSRFYWGHMVPALVGALAAPLGLAHGLLVSPTLDAILPYWLAALVLGVLAYPRGRELQGFDLPMTTPGEPAR